MKIVRLNRISVQIILILNIFIFLLYFGFNIFISSIMNQQLASFYKYENNENYLKIQELTEDYLNDHHDINLYISDILNNVRPGFLFRLTLEESDSRKKLLDLSFKPPKMGNRPENFLPPPDDNKYIQKDIVEIKNKSNKEFKLSIFSFRPQSYGFFIQLKKYILYISLSIFAFSFILLIVFSVWFSKPINLILEKINNLTQGIYDNRLIVYNNNNEFHTIIKELYKLTDILNKNEEFRKRITSNISHDISTPVMIIKSYLFGFKDRVITVNSETLSELLEEIDKLEEMIKSIKTLESVQQIKKEEIDLSQFIEKYMNKMKNLYADVLFELHVKQNIKIFSNLSHWDTILSNLIQNSIKYNDSEQKNLIVRLFQDKGKIIFQIKDNGIGIDKDKIPYIYERFYRGDDSRNSKIQGRGLGLSMVKEIVDLSGWQITCESEINQYTLFTITIPQE